MQRFSLMQRWVDDIVEGWWDNSRCHWRPAPFLLRLRCAGNILKLGDFGISRVLNSDTELANTVVRARARSALATWQRGTGGRPGMWLWGGLLRAAGQSAAGQV